jgi:hypothetical protein
MATTYKIMHITKDKQLIGQEITLTKANSETHKLTLQDVMDKIDKLQKENSNNFKEINKRLDYIVSANNLKDIESK